MYTDLPTRQAGDQIKYEQTESSCRMAMAVDGIAEAVLYAIASPVATEFCKIDAGLCRVPY